MAWTPEHRRRYAPALNDMVRTNAAARPATTIAAIDPPPPTGRPRLWSTTVMLQALWWLCRAGAAWRLLPAPCPPRRTIGSRLERRVGHEVLERTGPGRARWLAALGRHPRHAERQDRPAAWPARL
jgi:hypothetical protein